MFGKGKLMREGAQAQALVLDKNSWDVGEATGEVKACTYKLKVQFDDGSTAEIKRRVVNHDAAWVGVGELLPVRYDDADRTKIEVDEPALKALREQQAGELKARLVAAGERKLAQAGGATAAGPADALTDAERLSEIIKRHRSEGS
jgi:hypothetical protein